jgi:hypothetical protein
MAVGLMAGSRMEWYGDEVEARTYEAAADGLGEAMEHLLGVSQQLVPLEEGTLLRTGKADADRGDLVGAVSFDGPYAVVQHEALDYRHDPGRQAKYLESPAHAEAPTMAALIAARIREAMA